MQMEKSTVGLEKTVIVMPSSEIFESPPIMLMYSVAITPRTIPMYPKTVVTTTLSIITPFRIDTGRAPSALRIPNSWVRSFTVMSIILLMPTTPLIKVRSPMTQRAM